MANTFSPNKKTELVLIRSAEAAPFLTVGSDSRLQDQLVGKRNGQSYEFVIRDAGEFQEGMDISEGSAEGGKGASDLTERKVNLNIEIGNVAIKTNFLEKVTDVNWDKEVAIPQGEKIAKGLVKKVLKNEIGKQNTAFVGQGWMPLFKASNFLESISSDAQFAFVDPSVESVMQSTGKGFAPTNGVEPMYQKGLKGTVASAEVRAQQGMPSVIISANLAAELATATVTGFEQTTTGFDYVKLSGVTQDIPKGTPIFVEEVYATDLVGEKTSALKAFIAVEKAEGGVVKVRHSDISGEGTKELCDADGDALAASSFNSKKLVNTISAGTYFPGIFRCKGAFEFDTLPELDWSNADSRVTSPQGITMHTGRAVDVLKGTNVTRYAIAAVAGTVEPRVCSYVLVKDATANLIAQ